MVAKIGDVPGGDPAAAGFMLEITVHVRQVACVNIEGGSGKPLPLKRIQIFLCSPPELF